MATIRISESTLKKVKRVAKKQQINNGEFVDLAADFFIKTELDLDADYSIKSEIRKLAKRVNDAIGFIRTNEKEHLIPIIKATKEASVFVKDSTRELEGYIKLYKPNRIEQAYTDVQDLLSEMTEVMTQNFSVDKAMLTKRINELEARNKNLIRQNTIASILLQDVTTRALSEAERRQYTLELVEFTNAR